MVYLLACWNYLFSFPVARTTTMLASGYSLFILSDSLFIDLSIFNFALERQASKFMMDRPSLNNVNLASLHSSLLPKFKAKSLSFGFCNSLLLLILSHVLLFTYSNQSISNRPGRTC